MKFNTFLLMCSTALFCLGGCDKSEPIKDVKKSNIKFIEKDYFYSHGRYSIDEGNYYFANSYAGFEFKVTNSGDFSITLTLESHVSNDSKKQYIAILLDGEEINRIEINEGTHDYKIDIQSDNSEHLIRVHKCNEPSFSNLTLSNITLDNAYFIPHQIGKRKKIEAYGDSITCGYGNIAKTNTEPFSMETEDACVSYAPLAAKELGFDCSLVSYSGIALAVNPFGSNVFLLDKYDTIDGNRKWDMSIDPADYYLINIGTNDNTRYKQLFKEEKEEAKKLFAERYFILANSLHELNKDAKIIFCFDMMTSLDQDLIMAIDQAYQRCESLFPGVACGMKFMQNNGGANGHPSKAGHQLSADDIVEKILEFENLK